MGKTTQETVPGGGPSTSGTSGSGSAVNQQGSVLASGATTRGNKRRGAPAKAPVGGQDGPGGAAGGSPAKAPSVGQARGSGANSEEGVQTFVVPVEVGADDKRTLNPNFMAAGLQPVHQMDLQEQEPQARLPSKVVRQIAGAANKIVKKLSPGKVETLEGTGSSAASKTTLAKPAPPGKLNCPGKS